MVLAFERRKSEPCRCPVVSPSKLTPKNPLSSSQAHQLDSPDFSNPPHLSTSLDDIFYLIKKTLYRILSTASIDTTVSLTREVRRVLERDVAEVWRAVIEGVFRDLANAGNASSGLGGGRAKEEERERREREAGKSCIVSFLDGGFGCVVQWGEVI